MSKYHRIKWRESDLQELKRVVKNYNSKVSRIQRKNPHDAQYLPKYWVEDQQEFTQKLSVDQLKELINTRQDLNREINALKRFSKRGSEKIVEIPTNDSTIRMTNWQKTEMNRRIGAINKRRKNRLKEISETPMKSRGEDLGYTRGEFGMGKAEMHRFSPMQVFTPSMNQRGADWKFRSILNESQLDYFNKKDYELRDNYIKGIKENYDYEQVKDIIERIENMPIKEFLKVFEAEDAGFEFASPDGELDLKHEEYKGYEEALREIWNPKPKPKQKSQKAKKQKGKKGQKQPRQKVQRNKSLYDLSQIKPLAHGHINIYDGRKKVAQFKTSEHAMKYVQKHDIKNFSFYVSKK